MRKITALRITLVISLLPFFTSCQSTKNDKDKIAEEKQPNIVWIVSEDNSKHYMKLFDENGVSTPNIEALADHGLTYTGAFSNAPVCSVARSTIISGCYGPRIGTQFHRKNQIVPMPEGVKMFPAYLRKAGYYTSNNSKEDYNIVKEVNVWDDSSKKAHWKNRTEGQPFFSVFNFYQSHEGQLHFTEEEMATKTKKANPIKTDVNSFKVQPNHPDTETFRYLNALYRDKMHVIDDKLGNIVSQLEKDGLLEDTFIFYYGDHGGILPGSKGYIYETGLHVPLVVRVPENFKHLAKTKIGSKVDGFVSFIDLGPTVLSLAGINVPKGVDGKPFLGKKVDTKEVNSRDEVYSYADRFDEKYDLVRSIRKGKYKYMRNFQPFNFDGLMNKYRYKQLGYQEWAKLYKEGKLNAIQSAFYEEKSPEMLFDIEADPFETKNLADRPEFKAVKEDLRNRLFSWMKGMPDLSLYPEHFILENGANNPVEFGQHHKQDIGKYLDLANLALQPYNTVEHQILTSLKSSDPWERYWGLINSSIFRKEAKLLVPIIQKIAKSDPQILNRVRAAEFLAMSKLADPAPIMIKGLYESKITTEALMVLNSMALLKSHLHNYTFDVDETKVDAEVAKDIEIQNRLEYLKGEF